MLEFNRGFDLEFDYTVEDPNASDGTPMDLSGYDVVVCDFDDEAAAIDKLSVRGTIEQVSPSEKRGEVRFVIANAKTAGWTGDVRIRYQVRLRVTGSSPAKWHSTGGPHPVVIADRAADELTVPDF